jgi:hypothetical protein
MRPAHHINGERAKMKSRPSLTAIGKEMNVSVAAVSNALSGKGRMSQELRGAKWHQEVVNLA